jgi:hypothetical protein
MGVTGGIIPFWNFWKWDNESVGAPFLGPAEASPFLTAYPQLALWAAFLCALRLEAVLGLASGAIPQRLTPDVWVVHMA